MNQRMTVHYKNEPIYNIVIDNSYCGLIYELQKFKLKTKRVCIVTETTVGPLYANEVKSLIEEVCDNVYIFTFDAGEASKNLDTVKKLYEFLIVNHFDRADMLVALGGGVVGDLTGYTAATYLRGIDFIQLPTSLLAQVDSSVGGKTGVDFDAYKNMVGAFHQPKLVYTNLSTLTTLTKRQFISGMAEVIKAGLIKDKEFYEWIKHNSGKVLSYDMDALMKIVYKSCDIKREVVENDFTEKGERAYLNYGHTLGHAIEKYMNFELLHGECVSLGMVSASYVSMIKGNITNDEYSDIVNTLKLYELPVKQDGFDFDVVINSTKNDKKMKSGVISFVVLDCIGRAMINREVSDEDMNKSLFELQGKEN